MVEYRTALRVVGAGVETGEEPVPSHAIVCEISEELEFMGILTDLQP
jgi:hypothetical protein